MVLDGFPFHVSNRGGIYDLSPLSDRHFANRWLNIVTTGAELREPGRLFRRRKLASLKSQAPDSSGAFALEGASAPRKECQYLLPLFGAAMLSAPEPALS
jgi:hypothetical protein